LSSPEFDRQGEAFLPSRLTAERLPFDSANKADSWKYMSIDLKNEVTKLNRQWMESYVKRDAAFLERYLSEDYTSTFPDGAVLDKSTEIKSLKSGDIALTEMTPREMNVRVYGEAAVITGRSVIKAKVSGEELSGEYRFTDVWVRLDNQWQAVASQVTRIAQP
jgi:ketosteroid isomerase-like protein